MTIYNELLRVAQMAKAGEISTSLKAGANALQGVGKRGAQAVLSIQSAPLQEWRSPSSLSGRRYRQVSVLG